MYAFSSILAALLRRERTGEGATLDITQLSNVQIEQLTERLVTDVFNKTVADW